MDAFTWCGRRDLTACCALLAGCLLGSPPGRLRTIRNSNVHRTFELRSCPHGFESLLFSYENKKTSQWMSFCFGAVEGIRTPMVSHTDLNRARLPIPPRPRIGCSESVKHFHLSNIQYYTTSSAQLQRKDSQNAGKIAENAPRSFTKPSGITPIW